MQWSDEVKPLVKDLDLGMCCFEKSWGRLAKIMLTLLVKAKILNLCPWDTNVPNVKCSVFIDISFQLLGDLFIINGTREQVRSCMNRVV